MSRHIVKILHAGVTDENACIGFDPGLRTFFMQGFNVDHGDFEEPSLWLGTCLEEYPSLDDIITTARARGYEVKGLTPNLVIELVKEAGQKYDPGIGERLGIVF